MIVDFHVHSTASDGTREPADLAAEAVSRGFRAIALTDQDNCDGLAGFAGVPGIELSIEPGAGFDKFHLLGLGIDWRNERLKSFLRRILEGRNERNERIFANFRRLGIDIRPEPHGEVLARPHFAKWLMDNGYVATVGEAFDKYLLDDSPAETRCYETRYHPSQEESFAVIHEAGGICVMAHPRYWKDEWKRVGCDFDAAERELAELKDKGLDGLEALYQANTPEEDVGFALIADRVGLLKSAGSDYHGATKPTISLGMEVSEAFIKPLLERLGL